MSHFPLGWPTSLATGTTNYRFSADNAIKTANTVFATTLANLDMKVAAKTNIFTTASDRGRFFPISIGCVVSKGYNGVSTAPVISIGFGVNSDDFVSAATLTNISSSFATGQWEVVPLVAGLFSAPVSTTISVRVVTPSNAAMDLRSINILGYYVG